MKKRFVKIASLVLTVILALSLVACGNNTQTSGDDDSMEVIDLGGSDVVLVAWGTSMFSLIEESDDELNQTYWARKEEMEEKYNCNIVLNKVGATDILPGVRAGEMAGTLYADAVAMRASWAKSAYDEDLLLELGQLFDEEDTKGFYKSGSDCLMQDDGSYYTISLYKENPVENVFMFNVDHFENMGVDVDALYQEVLDGKWTFERMVEIAEKVTVEKNGVIEVYGMQSPDSGDVIGDFLAPFGAQMMDKNEDGTYSSGLKSDNMTKALETLSAIYQNKNFWKPSGNDNWETATQMFKAGTLSMVKSELTKFRDYSENNTFDVGMLPMPKASEEDDYVYSSMTLNVITMPASASQDMKRAQAVANILSYIYAPLDEDMSDTLARKYSMYASNDKLVDILLDMGTSDNMVYSNHWFTGLNSSYNSTCRSVISDILKGNVSIKAGIDSIDQAWQGIIEEYNDSLK